MLQGKPGPIAHRSQRSGTRVGRRVEYGGYVRAAEEDLVCARTEVSDLRAQLEVSLGERD